MPSSRTQLLASWLGLTALMVQPLHAQLTIAHRGLFHDVTNGANIAENSLSALQRAADFGITGVEFDVRSSLNGVPFCTHDMISNRATIQDNAKGLMNPIDVALKKQSAPAPIYINQHNDGFWNLVPLKTYGRGGQIIQADGAQKMETLEAMLGHLKNLNKPSFMFVLDLQDVATFDAAAALVKKTGTQNQVYLKFFVKKAIEDIPKYKGHAGATCYQYAKDHGFNGLQVIPQFNDGELTIVNNKAYIKIWGEQMLVTEYLSCWFDAQKQYGALGALVPIVAASVPYQNDPAHQAAQDALLWASEYGRKRMSILPNPDAGRSSGKTCVLYNWQSTNVAAGLFNLNARNDKEQFTKAFLRSGDYLVIDAMGDVKTHTYSNDFKFFSSNLC